MKSKPQLRKVVSQVEDESVAGDRCADLSQVRGVGAVDGGGNHDDVGCELKFYGLLEFDQLVVFLELFVIQFA